MGRNTGKKKVEVRDFDRKGLLYRLPEMGSCPRHELKQGRSEGIEGGGGGGREGKLAGLRGRFKKKKNRAMVTHPPPAQGYVPDPSNIECIFRRLFITDSFFQ